MFNVHVPCCVSCKFGVWCWCLYLLCLGLGCSLFLSWWQHAGYETQFVSSYRSRHSIFRRRCLQQQLRTIYAARPCSMGEATGYTGMTDHKFSNWSKPIDHVVTYQQSKTRQTYLTCQYFKNGYLTNMSRWNMMNDAST